MSKEYLIGKIIQFNNKAEAEAIEYYSQLLEDVKNYDLDEQDKEYIISVIEEIIADELNHQQRLQELYTFVTEIEPKTD